MNISAYKQTADYRAAVSALVFSELSLVWSIAAIERSDAPIRVNKLPKMFSSSGVRFFAIATVNAFASKATDWPSLKQ